MSFFSRLTEIIGEEYSVQITVQKKGRNLSISVLPNAIGKEKSGKTLVPVVISGTPDQIDAGLISAIAQPIASLNQLVVSGQAFVKEEKKSTTKKAEPVKKNEPVPTSLKDSKPESDTAKEPEVMDVKTTSVEPADMVDEPVEALPAEESIESGQANMFDDEDWA